MIFVSWLLSKLIELHYIISKENTGVALYNKVVLEVKNIHRKFVEVLGLFDNKLVVCLSTNESLERRSRG